MGWNFDEMLPNLDHKCECTGGDAGQRGWWPAGCWGLSRGPAGSRAEGSRHVAGRGAIVAPLRQAMRNGGVLRGFYGHVLYVRVLSGAV
jgi:hypothetical protein